MKKRILCLILSLAMLITSLGVLAACGEEDGGDGDGTHTHSYSDDWKTDQNNHWKECSCGEKKQSQKHVFTNGSDTCDTCGYTCNHTVVEGEYLNNTTKHWSKVSCGHNVQLNAQDHTPDSENKCTVCGYQGTGEHIHTFSEEWTKDDSMHWHATTCGCINVVADSGYHKDADSNQECDVCGQTILPDLDLEKKYEQYNWNTTELIVCINEDSNREELSSAHRRYLAGEVPENKTPDLIDQSVAERNKRAYEKTKVHVTYTYWGTGDTDWNNVGWGNSITKMISLVNSDAEGSPDIYINQIYDMVSAQLQGAFANSRSIKQGNGLNYFSYTDEEFVEYAEATGKEYGYMMEYMSELGFSVKKQYLIASDYFVDLVRAFYIVPLNLSMLNLLDITKTTGDRTNEQGGAPDGKFTAADFYDMVMKGEWTYDVLIQYSQAIYDPSSGVTGGSIDDRNGLILIPHGLYSSGLLYTTSIKMFERTLVDETGFFSCSYPPTNEDLYNYCDTLKRLVESPGVRVENVSHTDVRAKFASNKVLFGGVILLGSLEYDEYQSMRANGGFGILPVPLYQRYDIEYDAEGNEVSKTQEKYLTLIHNMGRICAIAANTDNFVQCTAFIDYQSTHSSDILDKYYKNKLEYDMSGGSLGNIQILEYIRSNVRSAFDKTYEDAIGWYFKGEDTTSSSWAGILQSANYKVDNMRGLYSSNASLRKDNLEKIIAAYADLPE